MEKEVWIACTVPARVLWRAPYAPALVRVAPNRLKLVWAAREDLLLDSQPAVSDELSATVRATLVREEDDGIVVSFLTRGEATEFSLAKTVLNSGVGSG